MKTFVLLLAASLFFGACGDKKSKEPSTDQNGQTAADTSRVQEAKEDIEKVKDDLGKLTPYSADELKAIFPSQLMGAEATGIETAIAMGASTAEAKYKLNDSADIKISVIDCAGPGGAGIYSIQYLSMLNVDEENEDEYTKTIDFNGGKAFESCRKAEKECTLTYFSGGRLLISLEGESVDIKTLKDVAKELKIK